MNTTHRVTIVTGASSGIGKATALDLARRDHHLVLVARGEEALQQVAEECRDLGACAEVAPCDIGDDEAVEALVADVVERHGRIDAVAHCAGQVTYGRFEDTTPEHFRAVLDTNLGGAANVARRVVPVLRAQQRGALVLVGSLLGHVAVPEMTAYVVSKWGVRALARQLKIENDDLPDVRIAYVAPGSTATPIYDKALDDGGHPSSPPPPVVSPERVARSVVRQLDGHAFGHGQQTALTNYALIALFTGVPAVYDRLIGPAFRVLSRR